MIVLTDVDYHLYVTGPVDWWAGWMTLSEGADAIDREQAEWNTSTKQPTGGQKFAQAAQALITRLDGELRALGWEGDYREPLRCAGLPSPDTCDQAAMFAIKQDNNGTCFFVSPYPLPWLAEDKDYAATVPRKKLTGIGVE